jgi:phosphoribosylformylglycinamidine cyclo-ligase
VTTYHDAGVDLEGAEAHVARIAPLVTATWGNNVVGGFGGFAAGIRIPEGYQRPVLMMSTDGVGTKLELARQTGRWDGVGFDLVAMCVDDLAAVGARPLGFVDYMAVGSLDASRDARIVSSIAAACRAAHCALVGGETAEHPGVMGHDAVDLAGAVTGIVEEGREINGLTIEPGDVIIGIESPNLRSNGFSLVRRVFEGFDLSQPLPDFEAPLAEVLLEPSVIYAPSVLPLMDRGLVKGAAHITGGGLPGNLGRPLPDGVGAQVERGSWEIPPIFEAIRVHGSVTSTAMEETFNLGIGFCLIVDPDDAGTVTDELPGARSWVIGRTVEGAGVTLS